MKVNRVAMALAAIMCTASVTGLTLRPGATAAQKGKAIDLEVAVPRAFGDWKELPNASVLVVDPQTQQLLDKLYSQTLVRTYVNGEGYRVMLSLAYGDDQRGGLAAHRPEVCYPAQGFRIGSIADGRLATSFGAIDVRRVTTTLGARNEPVTYWLTVGDQVIQTALDRRLAEIRLGLTGQIPDGILFRISSIDGNDGRGFEMQQRFTADLMAAVPVGVRRQLGGLTEAKAAPTS